MYSLQHIDTCLPCYLMDHHGREGEHLLCVSVDGSTTYGEVKSDLLSELNGLYDMPEGFDYAAAAASIEDEFSTAHPSDTFDSTLEGPTEHDDEGVYAYFVLSF